MKNILFLSLIFVFLSGCGKGDHSEHHHEEENHHEENMKVIHLSKKVQQNLGMTMATVRVAKLVETIEVYGEIAQETEQVVHVSAPASGLLESVEVELGEVVDPQVPLAKIRSEEGALLTLKSPSHGIVIGQYFKVGDRVDSLSSLFTITDPDVVRGSFDLYEKDLAAVKVGQKVNVETLSYPERTFEGEVVYISPRVDQVTRTIKVRADIQNTEEHALKFGMFVTGKIEQTLNKEALLAPLQSVHLINGKKSVFLKIDADEFQLTYIEVGERNSSFVEILSGLNDGDQVVCRGSFNLKSEFLKESLGGDGHGH